MKLKSSNAVELPVLSLKDGIIVDCSPRSTSFFEAGVFNKVIGKKVEDFFPTSQCNGIPSNEHWKEKVLLSQLEGIQTFPWKLLSAKNNELHCTITLVAHEQLLIVIINAHENSSELNNRQYLLSEINQRIEEGIYRCAIKQGFYYVNQAFVSMFGYETEREVLDLRPEEHYSLYDIPSDPKDMMEMMERSGFVRNKEILFRRKDGSRFWGLQSCYLHSNNEGEIFIDGIIIDITHIKESENLLRDKNNQLLKVQEEMDRFVYSVSHDLRAPLSSLLGLLNLAEVESNPDQLSIFIQMMKKSVLKLDHFINEILDYTRNARLELEDEVIDLEKMTWKVIQSIEYVEGFSTINKSVRVQSKSNFVSDAKRIKIILTNLITNAVLYHDRNKTAKFIDIAMYVDQEKARIEIVDNGKGISSAHLDKIFQMFYRASEDSKGSGLGLFMVKECVEKLEGSINVSSTFGIGTKFEIVLKNFRENLEPKAKLIEKNAEQEIRN